MKTIKGTTLTTDQLVDIIIEKGLDPLRHDDETITFMGWGFEIVLNVDGTYYISDTAGG